MSDDHEILYFFLGFTLDPRDRVLTRNGRPVSIQDKPLDLLLYLIRARGRVVPPTELLREVWPGVAVGPQALRFALHAARAALGDDGKRQTLLKTFPRRGIQFAGAVSRRQRGQDGDAGSGFGYTIPFLERERLQRDAECAIDAALHGLGQVLLIHGEAGIGKTRSIERIAELAKAHGFRVSNGHGVQGDQAPAYWPWVQILREAISSASPESRSTIVNDGALQLASLVPELQELISASSPRSLEDSRTTRFLLFDRVSKFIRSIALDSPLCLLFDDMHFSDPASLGLFEHLARALRDSRVLLVGTYRDIGSLSSPELVSAVAGTAQLSGCRLMELNALPISGIRRFVNTTYRVDPGSVSISYLYTKTNGNPFFLYQLLRVLEAEDRLHELEGSESPEIELPRQVQSAICRQVLFFPSEVVRVLEAAAVSGRDFIAIDLQRSLDIDPTALSTALQLASDARVLKLDSAVSGAYSFTHVLVRDAIYASLSTQDLMRLHRAVGLAIEDESASIIGPRAAELAYHFSKIVAIEGADRAVKYSEAAAAWAAQRAGFEEAVTHLENAESLLTGAGLGWSRARCAVLVKLGDARTRAGDRAGAREAFLEASEIARSLGMRDLVAAAALRYAPDFLAIETGVYDADQVAILEGALLAIGDSDQVIRAQLLAKLAVALHWSDEARERREGLIEEARNLARATDDREALLVVETAALLASFSVDCPERLLANSGILSTGGEPLILLVRRLISITALWLMGRIGSVRVEVEEFGAAARRLRQPQAIWYETLLRATLAQMEGQFSLSSSLAQDFLQRGELAGDRNARHSFMLQSFMSSVDLGKVEEFEDGVRGMVEAFPRVAGWRAGLLLLLAETERLVEADEQLEQLVAEGALEKQKRNEWYALIGAMGIAASRTENDACARKIYALLAPHREQLAVVGYGSFCWGSTEQLLGLCAMTAGENALARKHFSKAIKANRLAGAMPAVARTHRDLAWCLYREGRTQEARYHAEACVRISKRLGMGRVADRASLILNR